MSRRLLTLVLAALVAVPVLGQLTITTLAGSHAGGGWQDGVGTSARFSFPLSIAADAQGNLYVTDNHNRTVRRIAKATGQVTTLAGSADLAGTADGTGAAARFISPFGIAVDGANNVYVTDAVALSVRRITPAGVVTTLATGLTEPRGLACDGSGNVFVADGEVIRKITPAGAMSLYAGSDTGYQDGPALFAKFSHPSDIAIDGNGNLFVTDATNDVIREIAANGTVSTIAGVPGTEGSTDGDHPTFSTMTGIDLDAAGNLYVVDADNSLLRRVTPNGMVTTVAGQARVYTYRDGVGTAALFSLPFSTAVDRTTGAVYVVDAQAGGVRRFDPGTSAVTTPFGSVAVPGFANGAASDARFSFPHTVVRDSAGNLFVTENHAIRKITAGGVVSTFAGDPLTPGSQDGQGAGARFSTPIGLAIDSAGNLYVGDSDNFTIRKVTPAGVVSTIAGFAGESALVDGFGTDARFNFMGGLAVDAGGNVYVADAYNHAIRKIDPSGLVRTIAGSFESGFVDGVAEDALFDFPIDVALDGNGTLYIADFGNGAIRRLASDLVSTVSNSLFTPQTVAVAPNGRLYTSDSGVIYRIEPGGFLSALAGVGSTFGNVDGTGTNARLSSAVTLRFDSQGRALVADTLNHNVRIGTFDLPVVQSFTATPNSVPHIGDAATLAWSTTGSSVAIDGVNSFLPPSGSTVVHPTTTTTYRLTATSDSGTAVATVTVTVGAPSHRRAVAH